MARPRATTLQERMGFGDRDLMTPAHDAIMLWLDGAVKTSLAEWLAFPTTWEAWLAQELLRRAEPAIGLDALGELPPQPGFSVDKTIWEAPVSNAKGYELGFLDLLVRYTRQELGYFRGGLYGEGGRWELFSSAHAVGFEVKSAIPSLGELFRQLALYRQHFPGCEERRWGCRHCRLFVVSPDARFADKIREQGYGFIPYPDPSQGPRCERCGRTEQVGAINGRSICRACLT